MSSGLKLINVAPGQFASNFERKFESKAVVNNPDYLWGQTTFRGPRILASTLFEYLADGKTMDDFIEDFPTDRGIVVQLLEEIRGMLTP